MKLNGKILQVRRERIRKLHEADLNGLRGGLFTTTSVLFCPTVTLTPVLTPPCPRPLPYTLPGPNRDHCKPPDPIPL